MKKKTWFFTALVFILFVLFIMHAVDAVAEWRIEYSNHLIKAMRDAGYTVQKYHGSYCTKQECEEALRRASTGGFNISGKEAKCSGYDCPGKGSGGGISLGGVGSYRSSEDFARGMAMNLLGSMISAALNPQPQVDPDYEEYLRQQQEALAKKKAAVERKERELKWQQWQESRSQKDTNQLGDILGSVDKKSTGGGSLDGFLGVLENELQPRGTANYETSALSLVDRLRCATYFSNKASAAAGRGDHVNARYLNEQAQKAMLGQITDEECQFSALPDIPKAPTPQPVSNQQEIAYYESMIKSVQQDVKKLQDIDIKLKETDEKIKQAEEKKQRFRTVPHRLISRRTNKKRTI